MTVSSSSSVCRGRRLVLGLDVDVVFRHRAVEQHLAARDVEAAGELLD
jgi:hypothetical protein